MTFWWDGGNKCIEIHFYPKHIKLGFNIYTNKATKYIDSCYDKNIQFFGLFISYTDFNYNRIVHTILKPSDNYSTSDQAKNVASLKATLGVFSKSYDYHLKPPFSFNCELTDNGTDYIYYITTTKKYLNDNNLSVLIPSSLWGSRNEEILNNETKFPNYYPGVTHIGYLI